MLGKRHMPRVPRQILLILALVIPVLGWGFLFNSGSTIARVLAGTAPNTTPTPTYTGTPSATPSVEPELSILQYVKDTHPGWYCQGPSGTPGHRQLTSCYPFMYGSHPTNAYVDGYPSPDAAYTEWLTRRTNALNYPIFYDRSYGSYPGFEAGNTNYPFAHYENFFWGSVWVMGAISSDDTQFRGSPIIASAVYEAALALGYLGSNPPTATATPTPVYTGTSTATPAASPCLVSGGGSGAGCDGLGNYGYGINVENTCGAPVDGLVTILFEVSDSYAGPWTIWDQRPTFTHTFQPGLNHLEEDIYEGPIPWEYTLFRFEMTVVNDGWSHYEVTWPVQICGPRPSTPTITATGTPTSTPGAVPTCGLTNNYIAIPSTGATMVPDKTLVPGSSGDDWVVPIALPFRFYLYGQGFDLVRADTNGNLQFSGETPYSFNQCLPATGPINMVMPHWDNLDMRPILDPSLGIYTSTTGIAPNRTFNIEWRACLWNNSTCGGTVNFEVRLYENQNRFDFVYGRVDGSGGGATVGVQSMRGVGFTQVSCNTPSLQAGLQLVFLQQNCSNYAPSLVGHVTWEGRPPQPHALQQLPITLTLKMGGFEADYSVQTTDAYGFFTATVGSLPQGSYNWRVKGPKSLANAGGVTLTGSMYTQAEMGLMKTGDANNDNLVGAADFGILRAAFGTSVGDPNYDDRTNFNGDSTINVLDFILLRGNFGVGGAPPLHPSGGGAGNNR